MNDIRKALEAVLDAIDAMPFDLLRGKTRTLARAISDARAVLAAAPVPPADQTGEHPSLREALDKARERVREEFQSIAFLGSRACVPSAMLNVDALIIAAKNLERALSAPPAEVQQPAYCPIHQQYKWCEHNGGMMGPTGYEAPAEAQQPVAPDCAWEALQRLIEDGFSAGATRAEDAAIVAKYRRRFFAPTAPTGADAASEPADSLGALPSATACSTLRKDLPR
jgi:hypothetical protein